MTTGVRPVGGLWPACSTCRPADMAALILRQHQLTSCPLLALRKSCMYAVRGRRPALRSCRRSVAAAAEGHESNGAGPTGTHKPFVITTPLYYVNAAPHMGSAYSTIAADVTARYQRLKSREVMFITGTDEHGEKIATAAAAQSKSPQEHCDGIAAEFQNLWQQLDISADRFVRTTNPAHERLVAALLQKVHDQGDIYKATYEGHYCVGCESYKDDGEMTAGHICPIHRTECKLRHEENHFFRLSKYQKQLEQLLQDRPDFVQPAKRRNEVLGWIRSGAQDFSLSRAKVDWGIRVPWDPSQTIYVWTDALHGYLSALLQEGEEEASLESLTKAGWPADVHIIGKDILRFHAVMWPALLMSAGLPVPQRVVAHGFLTKDGLKMGKSLGNVLDPKALVAAYGADAVRFFFMKEITFGEDGDFSEERFQNIVNANLANDIGNLLNRSLNLLHKFCGGKISVSSSETPEAAVLRATATKQVEVAKDAFERLDFSTAAEALLVISGRGNLYMEEQAPWGALKKGNDEQKATAAGVLADVLESLRIVAVLLSPITPQLAQRIYLQLGYSSDDFKAVTVADASWGGLHLDHVTSKPAPVFVRIQTPFITEPPARLATAA